MLRSQRAFMTRDRLRPLKTSDPSQWVDLESSALDVSGGRGWGHQATGDMRTASQELPRPTVAARWDFSVNFSQTGCAAGEEFEPE